MTCLTKCQYNKECKESQYQRVHGAKSVWASVLTERMQGKACACPFGEGLELYLARWPISPTEFNPSLTLPDVEQQGAGWGGGLLSLNKRRSKLLCQQPGTPRTSRIMGDLMHITKSCLDRSLSEFCYWKTNAFPAETIMWVPSP